LADHLTEALSSDLQLVLEQVSEAVHEQWAKNRIKDGWKYGVERNDSLKETPCLVPYQELSENEKDYDRKTSLCVINALLKLGFVIERRNVNGQRT